MSENNRSRDVEKEYSDAETIRKLERLVDCMKTGKPFEIQVAGERIYVPVRARFTIEHEVDEGEEELEFQFRWSHTE
ncbi:MAG: amphi-Trp domain-containing protein [Pseudomonadota bacterium]